MSKADALAVIPPPPFRGFRGFSSERPPPLPPPPLMPDGALLLLSGPQTPVTSSAALVLLLLCSFPLAEGGAFLTGDVWELLCLPAS